MAQHLDGTSSSPRVAESGMDMAILPIGSTEQHGPHLPLSTDSQIAAAVAQGVAERLGAFLLPTIEYGNSDVHAGYRGTVSIRPETLQSLVLDIGHELQAQGFRRIILLNTHGGNLILRIAVRELNRSGPAGYKILLAQPTDLAAPTLRQIIGTLEREVHAGELETSLMLHLAPEQVGRERPDSDVEFSADLYNYTLTHYAVAQGVWGVSSQATAEKGALALEALIAATVAYAEHTFRQLADLESR